MTCVICLKPFLPSDDSVNMGGDGEHGLHARMAHVLCRDEQLHALLKRQFHTIYHDPNNPVRPEPGS